MVGSLDEAVSKQNNHKDNHITYTFHDGAYHMIIFNAIHSYFGLDFAASIILCSMYDSE